MAKVLGEAGRYVSQEVSRLARKRMRLGIWVAAVIFWISGFLVGSLFLKKLWWVSLLVTFVALVVVLLLSRWAEQEMDSLEKQQSDLRRGADGEISVGFKLKDFPPEYYVINDLKTRFGNLDHVVVGPTGIYAIDTKNWRGTVSADGKKELLLDGKPLDKPYIRNYVGRIMGIKERLTSLVPGIDLYIQGVFVFTSARVEAKWRTTGAVDCMRDERLYDYIVGDKKPKKLPPENAKAIAQAFLALARMDTGFDEPTGDKVKQATNI